MLNTKIQCFSQLVFIRDYYRQTESKTINVLNLMNKIYYNKPLKVIIKEDINQPITGFQ